MSHFKPHPNPSLGTSTTTGTITIDPYTLITSKLGSWTIARRFSRVFCFYHCVLYCLNVFLL